MATPKPIALRGASSAGTTQLALPAPRARPPALPAPSSPRVQPRATSPYTSSGVPSLQDVISQITQPQLDFFNSQRQSLAARQAQQQEALRGFTQSLLGILQGVPSQVRGAYDQAIRDTQALSGAAAQGLVNANPNGQAIAALQAIGAPQSQIGQVAQQNADVFGGGGGVLNFLGGTIPAQGLAANRAANVAFASELPAIQSLGAQQAFAKLLGVQGGQQSAIDEAVAKLRSDATGQAYGILNNLANQRLAQQEFGLRQQEFAAGKAPKVFGSGSSGYFTIDASGKIVQLTSPGARAPKIFGSAGGGYYAFGEDGSLTRLTAPNPASRATKLQSKTINGHVVTFDPSTGSYYIPGTQQRIEPNAFAKAPKPLTTAQRGKAFSFVQRAQKGFYASRVDPLTPLTANQINSAAKAAKLTVSDFLANTKEGASARAAAGVGVQQVGQHDDANIQNLYLTLVRQFQVPAKQAFDMVAKLYPQFGAAKRTAYFPNGGQRSRPFAASGASFTQTSHGRIESSLVSLAKQFGLNITSGFRSVAEQRRLYANRSAPGSVAPAGRSFHNSGRAIDVAVTPRSLSFVRYALQHPGQFSEVFYDPAGEYVKNGRLVRGAIGGHSDHVHIAI